VFGLSFGELVVLLLVAVVVLGPKELPRYLRKAGQLAGKLRQLAFDMRAKSGIDEILRNEGIGADIAEIRRLATFARGELGGIMTAVRSAADGAAINEIKGRTLDAPRPPPRDLPPSPYAPTYVGVTTGLNGGAAVPAAAVLTEQGPTAPYSASLVRPDRAREYPTGGVDAYGALPEGSGVYEGQLAQSPLAADPVYARGSQPPGASSPDASSAEAPPEASLEARS
jgi:sec-independent protein translocase protein TatB